MSDRYTHRDVHEAFAALVKEATACGIDASTWSVTMAGNNVSNYKLIGCGTTTLTGNFGSIGTTAKEATRMLDTARAAMAMVRNATL